MKASLLSSTPGCCHVFRANQRHTACHASKGLTQCSKSARAACRLSMPATHNRGQSRTHAQLHGQMYIEDCTRLVCTIITVQNRLVAVMPQQPATHCTSHAHQHLYNMHARQMLHIPHTRLGTCQATAQAFPDDHAAQATETGCRICPWIYPLHPHYIHAHRAILAIFQGITRRQASS